MVRRGAYFLANDAVLPWAAAFLCSFRRYNPDLPLCLIPYDDRFERIAALQHRYHFTIFENPGVLELCATIAQPFHPHEGRGHYRKLACWEGEFDEFVYIDVDTIVLGNVNFVFDILAQFDFLVATSNMPELVEWVWKPSIVSSRALSHHQIALSANTGFIASRKPALLIADVMAKLEHAAALAPHMQLLCIEQPLLNYLFVTSGRPITSLHCLGGHLPKELYAGRSGAIVHDGELQFQGRSPLFVHWPGQKLPNVPAITGGPMNSVELHRVDTSADTSQSDMPYFAFWKFYWDRA